VDTPEERNEVYGDRPAEQSCIDPGGGIRGKRVGGARLGGRREQLRAKLGPPTYARKHLDSWCLVGKGELRVTYRADDLAKAILTSGRGQSFHGVARGDRVERARRRLEIVDGNHVAHVGRVLTVEDRGPRWILLGVRDGRIRWVAVLANESAFTNRLISHVT
jgi:hypothetical protein